MSPARKKVASPLFNGEEVVLLGIVLAVLEALQVAFVHIPAGYHDAISAVIIFIGAFGVVPLAPAAIFKLIPAHVAALLTSSAAAIEFIQRSFLHVGPTLHAILGGVLVLLATIGIAPATVGHPPEALNRR